MTSKEYKSTHKTIRCGHCGNKTLMTIICEGKCEKDIYYDEYYKSWTDYHIKTLLCPNCQQFNIIQYSEDWNSIQTDIAQDMDVQILTKTEYLYPSIRDFADSSPKAEDIRDTYREALTCFQAELYTSSVVMCRKTIELLCSYFDVKEPYTLDGKLAKMREIEIIDNKLYEWANVLKNFGNEAVHTTTKFFKEDAQDILDFTYVLVEYCIHFDYKFEQLLKRRGRTKGSSEVQTDILTEETINSLVKALDANETSIRYYAAITLVQREINVDKVIPVLLAFTEKSQFRSNATNCLKSIGLKAVPELIKALKTHDSHNVRAAAATVLGDIGANNPDVIAALVNALKDKHEDVQYKAAIVLEKIGFTAIDTFIKVYNS
jgi:hypothetical protein